MERPDWVAKRLQPGPRMRMELAVALIFAPWGVLADEADGASRPFKRYSLEELMAVEVRAPTKFELPIREAPTVATVITREEIDSYGWRTLGEVLLRQAGFAPSQDYERITVSARGQYEGWNNNHLSLLIDGVPVNNVSNGTAFVWEMMPLSMVESIEIMRGPGSALYGSNATNGVIAINTRKPSAGGDLRALAGMGDAGGRAYDLSGGRALPWILFSAGYQYQESDGNVYDSYDASWRLDAEGEPRMFPVNDARSAHAGYLKLDGQGPLSGLSLQTHMAWWRFETAQGWAQIIPDEKERARSNRELVSLTYRPRPLLGDRLRLEAAAEWQRHEVDYRIKFLPDGATSGGTPYPDGITEIAQGRGNDYFARMQAEYRLPIDIRILFGVDNLIYLVTKGLPHQSNVDLNRDGDFLPFEDGAFQELRPVMESVEDYPVENMGWYLQFCSGRFLKRMVSATGGVRYDLQYFQYRDFAQSGGPVRERYLSQISPRMGLVFFPWPNLTLKALAERAFRAPAPSELFASNSLLGGSKPDQLQAEKMAAFTLAGDLALSRHLNLRSDWFYQTFDNQIAFSGSRNYVANLYSRTLTGFETELYFDAELGADWAVEGFVNHTWAHQVEEEVLEPAIAESDRLTWAPGQVINLGSALSCRGFSFSLQGHFQGPVYRRKSDSQAEGTPTAFSAFRPPSLDPWFTLDAALAYGFANGLRLRCKGTNLFDERGYLMKPGDYPFDYRIEGPRIFAAVEYILPGSRQGL